MKSIAVIICQIGVIIIFSAIFWWHSFYRVIAQQLSYNLGESDPTLGSGVRCLFSTGGACGEIIEYAKTLDKTVYTPTLFWSGITVFVLGLALLYLNKKLKRTD